MMHTAYIAVAAVGLLAMCLLFVRTTFKTWPTADKVNYAVMVVAVWPWILIGVFTTVPGWYTATAGAVFLGSLLWFIVTELQFLRRTRAELAELQARYAPEEDATP